MRILIVTSIFPPDVGGPATYVPHIATWLCARGHGVIVLTLSEGEGSEDIGNPLRVQRLKRKQFKPWRWLRTIHEILRHGRHCDLLFVNGLAMEAALANLWLRRPMVQKVVGDLAWEQTTNRGWTRASFEEFQFQWCGFRAEILKALRAWWVKKADNVIVPSRYLARWVGQWGVPAAKIHVIYNAVKPANGIVPARVPLDTPVKLITAARLVPWKGIDEVIRTIASLTRAGLIIAGDGPLRDDLEKLACDLNLHQRIYFAGSISSRETLALMAASHVFVLNSSYEGLPHVVLEAMSLGLPVVATAVGGTPEVVRDGVNGRLITPGDEGDMLRALAELVESPEERQRLAQGAKQTSLDFSFDRMLEESAAVLAGTVSS